MITQNTEQLFIHNNVPLADKNWFKTGGAARFYCEPSTTNQMIEGIAWAQKNSLPLFMLGQGANILISDAGYKGLVMRPVHQKIEIISATETSALVKAGAGVIVAQLINFCLDNQLSGLEEFSGIPGTVGGSVFINIHFFQHLLSDYLVQATVINKETGAVLVVDRTWFNFGYDYSKLHEGNFYLADATFRLKKISALEAAYGKGRRDEMIWYRGWRYPRARTCGSFFRNFHDNEVTLMSQGKKMIYVAYYFDRLGFKGELSYGGALVSYLHANMIVTQENAKSNDVIMLARMMQEATLKEFGILPQPECQLVGFAENPLLILKN